MVPVASIQRECVKHIPGRNHHVLMVIEHVRLRRVRNTVQTGVPEGLTILGIESDQVLTLVGAEQELARGRLQA
jgi:hypothetical protein